MSPDDPILARIQRQAGVDDLVELLAERMPATDLQSLLLAAARRRAARVTPASLLARYEQDRHVAPSPLNPVLAARLDLLAWSLLGPKWDVVELAPVAPLGAHGAIAAVSQDKVLTTTRLTEVVADHTNVLALECAVRRRRLLQAEPHSTERVLLAASHRVHRMQPFEPPDMQHFRLFGTCVAGRDEGGFRFEAEVTGAHLRFYLELLDQVPTLGVRVGRRRVAVVDLTGGLRSDLLQNEILEPLAREFPDVDAALEVSAPAPDGAGYYRDVRFQVFAHLSGDERLLADGGSTTFTAQLLANAKERLVVSGFGTERLCVLGY